MRMSRHAAVRGRFVQVALVWLLISARLAIGADESTVQVHPPSGIFTNSFVLSLSATDPSATILFTLNGTIPHATNSSTYESPIAISNSTRLRAVAVGATHTSEVVSASYIRIASDLVNYTSTLPIMVIENFGGGTIPQNSGIKQAPRQSAVWTLFERVDGVSAFTNAPQLVSDIGIRVRGASSSGWTRKPYGVEAVHAMGDEREVSPLGLPAHADWVLYYPDPLPVRDLTMLYNTSSTNWVRSSGVEARAFVSSRRSSMKMAAICGWRIVGAFT